MSEVTEIQLKANQENSKLGGVKTEEGKEVSKYNALKHGLLSKEVFIKGENEQELIELGKNLRTELKPVGALEQMLVDRISANIWRLKRAMRVENGMIESNCNEEVFMEGRKKTLGEALQTDFINYDTYGKLTRYETSIERGFYKALHELQRLQSSRTGQGVPPPIALDLDLTEEK